MRPSPHTAEPAAPAPPYAADPAAPESPPAPHTADPTAPYTAERTAPHTAEPALTALPPASQPTAPKPRPRRRRALRALSTLLIVAGALVLADGVATLVWQEPITAVYARVQQERLDDELDAVAQTPPSRVERRALAQLPDPRRRAGFEARALARRSAPGDPLGRLRIPAIGLSTVVVEGTDGDDLRAGPGHYEDTVLPGRRGTVGIAGHRTTYGAPFRRLDDLDRGDRIELAMPYGRFAYRVEETRIVPPTAVDVLDRGPYDRLVLTACHPLYSADERIVLFAVPVKTP